MLLVMCLRLSHYPGIAKIQDYSKLFQGIVKISGMTIIEVSDQ
jgi:hypothetical protein